MIDHVYSDEDTEDEQILWVKKNTYNIEYIKNPSEAVCMAAVEKNGHAIQFIENPSEAVCLAAIRQGFFAFRCIQNPSETVQIQAIKLHSETITLFDELPCNTMVAFHLLHHPRSSHTPKDILDRAPEILENHCPGLGDVYTLGLSMNMTGEELSRTMIEWIESHIDVTADVEISPM